MLLAMTRREFLKSLAASSLLFVTRRAFPQSTGAAGVGVVRGGERARAVERAVELVGGMGRFVSRGSVVVVKPNMAFNVPPQYRATTDPVVVRTVVDLCFKAGASRVYVFDRTVGNPRLTYVTSGVAEAARQAGARVLFVDQVSPKLYARIPVPGGSALKETLVNRRVLEADAFINLPVAKHHSSAGLTIGMKNLMGVTGDNRSRWHWKLDQSIADINSAVRSHLTVVDAGAIMVRGGPTGGSLDYLKPTDTVIASANVVEADAEAVRLFDREPASLGYLELAAARGMGKLAGYSRQVTVL